MAQFPTRQLRHMLVPMKPLIAYHHRMTGELPNHRLHHANADQLLQNFHVYLETEYDKVTPLEIELPWEELFGRSLCPETGKLHHVNEFSVSTEGAYKLRARIAQLERFIVDSGLIPPTPQKD